MTRIAAATVSALLIACSPDEGPRSEPVGTLPPGTAPRFAGELELVGELARERDATVTLSIRRIGQGTDDRPMLTRRFEAGDPMWRERGDRRFLYFAIDARDAEPRTVVALDAQMELVARFDPDGDPTTDEPGIAAVRRRVRTGDAGLEIVLERPPTAADAPRAARAGQGG